MHIESVFPQSVPSGWSVQKSREPPDGHPSERDITTLVDSPDAQHTEVDEGLKDSNAQTPLMQSFPIVHGSLSESLELAHFPPTQASLTHIESFSPQSVPSGWSVQNGRRPLDGHPSEVSVNTLFDAPDAQHTVEADGLKDPWAQTPPTQSLPTVQDSLSESLEPAHFPPTQASLAHIEWATPQGVPSGRSVQNSRRPSDGHPSEALVTTGTVAPDAQHTSGDAGP